MLPSAHVTTLGNRNKLISKRYQHFREHGLPCGLHDSLCTLHLLCSFRTIRNSATDATLNTGGWLSLTRRGLAPRKMHQASLGALTTRQKVRLLNFESRRPATIIKTASVHPVRIINDATKIKIHPINEGGGPFPGCLANPPVKTAMPINR